MDSFNVANMEALQELIAPEQEDQGHIYGSALGPQSIHGKGEKKELARPNTEVVVKTFNRDAKGGAPAESLKQEQIEKKMADPKNQIWTQQEVSEAAEEMLDDRR